MPSEGDAAIDFVTSRTEQVYEFCADQTRAAKDDYFHILIFGLDVFAFIMTGSSSPYDCPSSQEFV